MANFDTLKATIAARIPDNIDQLITAEDVRQSFLDTIDEINAAKEDDGAVAPAVWGGISGDIADQTDLQTALGGKQATLVSGTNIKTINNESLLGGGNIVIPGGGGASVWGQITGDLGDQTDLKNALDGKADKVTGAISGHLAGLDANGDLTDSGSKASDFATATQGAKADTAVQPGSLAAVATSGDYDDLLYKPSIPAAPGTLNTDNSTAQTTSSSEALSGAVKLHKVSKTGSYNDLLNKPTIPAAQVQADWNEADNTKADYIKNKPSIPAAQVNADWDAASGVAQILNKPTIPAAPGTLDTTATTAQATNAGEALSGSVVLHKISKTGDYGDLLNKPTIPVVEALTDAEIDAIWANAS